MAACIAIVAPRLERYSRRATCPLRRACTVDAAKCSTNAYAEHDADTIAIDIANPRANRHTNPNADGKADCPADE